MKKKDNISLEMLHNMCKDELSKDIIDFIVLDSLLEKILEKLLE